MDTGRLKTIVILILVCVNLAFGGILLSERLGAAEGNAHTRSELMKVMAGLGIAMTEDQLPEGEVRKRCTVPRDREAERALVRALLGEAEETDQGGNIWYYENENGWAWCRGGGSFEFMLLSGGGSLERQLSAGGLRVRREGDYYVCLMGDTQVFNCRFSLGQRSGGVYISGRFLPWEPIEEEDVDCTDVATLLLRFCDRVRDAGGVFSRVEEIRSGYVLNVTASGMELVPVWQLRTDGGTWYMDLQAGRLVAVA
ncbi:MAG: hypothetical protein IKP17_02230 [Oscillospiraceae bacterium]|nr:hypothetical protein [Oscillospiraceae bacterium]